ncbi:MAG: acyltransferase [Selenomonadaceae bacterium]|nr:acyltransferase [Selenomonadaceae bacterium]
MANTKKQRLPAIEYIRGISMLGVIGIHVGSQYMMNPSANVHLLALFEIVTRFAVPIFFFISAFGLFYNLDINKNFDYIDFMQRRFKTVLIPYLVWSAFYLIHDNFFYGVGLPDLFYLIKVLFFGLAKYQLYFLVLLLWFYLLMPIWIDLVRIMTPFKLVVLLIFQVAFNHFSSFNMDFIMFIYNLPENSLLKWFLMYRLNYWILHYIFIFILGGYVAVHIKSFMTFMKQNDISICMFFMISLTALLTHYYLILYVQHLTPEAAVNTAHQLSPAGIAYTITASVFYFTIFTFNDFSNALKSVLSFFGKHSYFAYLFHPFIISWLELLLQSSGRIMTASIAIIFYIAVVTLSIFAAVIFRTFGEVIPIINKLTIGVYAKNKKVGGLKKNEI